MEIPAFVLDPSKTKETYICIEQVEPGSVLAHAIVEAEWNAESTESVREAAKRVRLIATYLKVPFVIP